MLFNYDTIMTQSMKQIIEKFVSLRRLRIVIPVAACFCLGMAFLRAQSVYSTFTVDISSPGPEVAPICRDQQIEEFNYQFQGGLYAQLINNPSFRGA